MKRAANPQGAHKARRKRVYYADPAYPQKSRCRDCFPLVARGKLSSHDVTKGPCWLCTLAAQERTIYLTLEQMADDLTAVAASLELLSQEGFQLAIHLSAGTGGTGTLERDMFESFNREDVASFRKSWADARRAVESFGIPNGKRATAYGHIVLGVIGLPPQTIADPRVVLSDAEPTSAPVVDAFQLLRIAGQLAYAVRHITAEVPKLRAALVSNHGLDCDEPLRMLRQAFGASQLRLIESALAYLKPNGQLDERDLEDARIISNRLRQRSLKRRSPRNP